MVEVHMARPGHVHLGARGGKNKRQGYEGREISCGQMGDAFRILGDRQNVASNERLENPF